MTLYPSSWLSASKIPKIHSFLCEIKISLPATISLNAICNESDLLKINPVSLVIRILLYIFSVSI